MDTPALVNIWAEIHVFRKRLSGQAALAACLEDASSMSELGGNGRGAGVVRPLFDPPIEISENTIRKGKER